MGLCLAICEEQGVFLGKDSSEGRGQEELHVRSATKRPLRPRDRIWKRLFTPSRSQLYIVPHEMGYDPPLSIKVKYASEVPGSHWRYLCDCRCCIGHPLELENIDHPVGTPSKFEPRFVTLPGLKWTLSDDPIYQQLVDLYHRRPELSLAVCGCRDCTRRSSHQRIQCSSVAGKSGES